MAICLNDLWINTKERGKGELWGKALDTSRQRRSRWDVKHVMCLCMETENNPSRLGKHYCLHKLSLCARRTTQHITSTKQVNCYVQIYLAYWVNCCDIHISLESAPLKVSILFWINHFRVLIRPAICFLIENTVIALRLVHETSWCLKASDVIERMFT